MSTLLARDTDATLVQPRTGQLLEEQTLFEGMEVRAVETFPDTPDGFLTVFEASSDGDSWYRYRVYGPIAVWETSDAQ